MTVLSYKCWCFVNYVFPLLHLISYPFYWCCEWHKVQYFHFPSHLIQFFVHLQPLQRLSVLRTWRGPNRIMCTMWTVSIKAVHSLGPISIMWLWNEVLSLWEWSSFWCVKFHLSDENSSLASFIIPKFLNHLVPNVISIMQCDAQNVEFQLYGVFQEVFAILQENVL
jgi:hypothetical protein